MTGIGQRIRRAREALGLSQKELAEAVGIKQQTLQKLETDADRGTKHINKLARELQQDAAWLEENIGEMRQPRPEGTRTLPVRRALPGRTLDPTLDLREIKVIGAVQAGVWLPTVEWPLEDQYEMPLPIQMGYRGFPVQGLMVRGPSMDEIYPHGSIVVCVKFIDLGRDPRSGERVVALRLRHGECEATVKEYRVDRDGKARLWPRSTHPDFQRPIAVDDPMDDDADELQIAYLVIGSYRPEI